MTGRQEIRNPPAYFTTDWEQAKKSVQILAVLNPWVAATGHGVPMCGPAMRNQLNAWPGTSTCSCHQTAVTSDSRRGPTRRG